MGNPAPANLDPTDRPPPRRRSIPLFLRLGLTALVVLGLSAAAMIETRISRQRPIVNEIEKAGGLYGTRFEQNQGVHYDWLGRLADSLDLDRAASDVVVVELSGPKVTDASLACLRGLPALQTLMLDGKQITDRGLKHLACIATLNRLRLRDTSVTDDGLVHLKGLHGLKVLSLCGSDITDAGLVHLRELGELESLDLSRTKVTDAAVEALAAIPNLEAIGLDDTGVSDEAIADLNRIRPTLKVERRRHEPRGK